MFDEFENVGSLNFDTDKFDDIFAPVFTEADSSDVDLDDLDYLDL